MINILQTKEFHESKIDTNFISNYYKEGFKGKTDDLSKLEIMAITVLSNNLKYLQEVNKNFDNISKNWVLVSNKIFLIFR